MKIALDSINALTFAEMSGMSSRDKYVLDKYYKHNILKTTNEWQLILKQDFVIPIDLTIVEENDIIVEDENQSEDDKSGKLIPKKITTKEDK